ncbi:hypothetical protein Nepgr_001775 [Nepenthes gracilis]|uniref:Seipin n=1 Tax=Nepenthes gracilis TaxID=150966 RepID=A0AAD3P541_NEPGR|nr:hypothetical protein Nepgr_001775 [Nepenthes gracilis]
MEEDNFQPLILKQATWLPKVVEFQVDLISNCIISLFSPVFSLSSLIYSQPFLHRPQKAQRCFESAPSGDTSGGALVLLKRIGYGFVGATYVGVVLTAVMVVAVVFGAGLVQLWVEEPVFVREKLYFDYTDFHPKAVFSFTDGGVGEGWKKTRGGVPVGHTIYVSLVLLMPESDFNREIGVFQLKAEVLSRNGDIIARSSQPCILLFRSHPIHLMRTYLMAAPLLLGIMHETQKETLDMLEYKERHRSGTEAIRITLMPRAGTSNVPQLYEAEIVVQSKLPWVKELVRSWKLTFTVWSSLYIYVMLVIVLSRFKPLIFPAVMTAVEQRRGEVEVEEVKPPPESVPPEEFSKTLQRWQQNRRKRKAALLSGCFLETVGSSAASSLTITREETCGAEEDVGDSESVCF